MSGIALLSLIALCSVSWTGTLALQRLSSFVIPEVYKIHLEPNFANDTFKGNVTIEIFVKNETSAIGFHAKDLEITSISLGTGIKVQNTTTMDNTDIMIVYLDQLLKLHQTYYMNIVYEGILRSDRYGFYRIKYTHGDVTKWIAMTQLQPTGARHVFPCWDEPNYKAAFDISVTHLENYTTVISNMPIYSRIGNGETITSTFVRTIKMSTYLVAIVVSDYDYKSQADDRIKIYTKPDGVDYTNYAWNFTVKTMNMFKEYTGISYFNYMPKLDQATTVQFDTVGMENWGLVIYREEILLYEEGVSTTAHKEMVSKTIAHEVAHQWFGNLVTLDWWDYLWLNEGFAKYFEMYVVDKLEPTWRARDMFAVETVQAVAFKLDASPWAIPMNKPVDSDAQIWSKFNCFSYEKAGCVIRMFSQILTEEVLHDGLKTYLNEYTLGNADSDDLLYHLDNADGADLIHGGLRFNDIADNWVNQPGFPLVTVTKICQGIYMLSQNRFRDHATQHTRDTMWWIPITYATNHKLNFTDISVTNWLPKSGENITISEPDADWIILNKQQMGYYRVNYDEETWRNLSNFLKTDMHKIHPVNRAQLLDDIFTMADMNITKYETALSLALYLTQEIDYVPWMTFFRLLKPLRFKLFPAPHYETFKHYIRFIMHSLTKYMTYEASPNDSHTTKILRSEAMHWACLADVKECRNSARKYFNKWLHDPLHRIDPNLEKTILCTGLRTASEKVWAETRRILERGTFESESTKSHPLEVLGCSSNREILKKFLIKSMGKGSRIDFLYAAKSVIYNTNVPGVDIVQDVLDLNLKEKFVDKNTFVIKVTPVMPHIAKATVNNDQYMRLSFFRTEIEANPAGTAKLLAEAKINILWINRYGDRIDRWLVANEEAFSSSGTLVFTSFLLILSIFITRYF